MHLDSDPGSREHEGKCAHTHSLFRGRDLNVLVARYVFETPCGGATTAALRRIAGRGQDKPENGLLPWPSLFVICPAT